MRMPASTAVCVVPSPRLTVSAEFLNSSNRLKLTPP